MNTRFARRVIDVLSDRVVGSGENDPESLTLGMERVSGRHPRTDGIDTGGCAIDWRSAALGMMLDALRSGVSRMGSPRGKTSLLDFK